MSDVVAVGELDHRAPPLVGEAGGLVRSQILLGTGEAGWAVRREGVVDHVGVKDLPDSVELTAVDDLLGAGDDLGWGCGQVGHWNLRSAGIESGTLNSTVILSFTWALLSTLRPEKLHRRERDWPAPRSPPPPGTCSPNVATRRRRWRRSARGRRSRRRRCTGCSGRRSAC